MSDNPYIEAFVKLCDSRFVPERDSLPMSEWVLANTSLKGKPFSYKGYEFQSAIVDDMHPDLAVLKCAQIGLTECEIRKSLGFVKRFQGTAAMFTLPEEKLFKKISQTRIQPVVDYEPVFNMNKDEKQVRSVSVIQIGRSFLYITGCTEGDATSTSADALFHDELDLSPPDMIALYQSRLQNSNWKITQRFSTPSFVGFGIDKAYTNSDQREYVCKCLSCGHYNIPTFERRFLQLEGLPTDLEDLADLTQEQAENLDLLNAYVCCEKCQAQLDLANPSVREWVPMFPSRSLVRGYRVRPFSTSRLNIGYIITQLLKYKERDYVRGWHNTVLGEPYTASDVRLSEADIRACMKGPATPDVGSDVGVFMGVDIGQVCHLVLGVPGRGIFHFETVSVNDLEQRVTEIDKVYRLIGGACDRHPYTPTADAIREITGGRVLPVEYRGTTPINFVKDEFETITHAQVNRTMILDDVARSIRKKLIVLEGYNGQEALLIQQLRDEVRDEKPDEPAKWIKLTGNDHYFHALAFYLAGIKLRGALDAMEDVDPRTMLSSMAIDVISQGIPFGIKRGSRQDHQLGFNRFGL